MTTIRKLRFVALSFLATSGVIACGVNQGEETESAEADIIQFPAAVFANAPTIAYGQTLPNEPFLKSKQFRAVRFMATAGERLTGTVTAAGMKSIVYVVRKEGTKFVNVKAGGVNTAAPNMVIHTVEESGEHFLVFRTVPRADATFSVNLEKAAGLLSCADMGQTPSLQALVGAVQDGEIPQDTAKRNIWFERRECTYATGCGPTVQGYEPAPSFSFVAVKAGANFVVESKLIDTTSATLSPSGILSGHIFVPRDVRNPHGPSVTIPFRGTVGPTCMSIEESVVKIPVDARNYTEVRVLPVAPEPNPLPSNVHPPAGVLAPVPELETITDEEVLSRFPRGATTLTFPRPQPLIQGAAAGEQRYCHPLTSCSAPEPTTAGASDNDACMRYARESDGLLHNALIVQGAQVSGRDGYALITNRGVIPIEDGIGKVGSAVLRVGENDVQLTFPAVTGGLGNGRTKEVSNTTCTFRFTWPAMP